MMSVWSFSSPNPIALRTAKTLGSFSRFECNRVKTGDATAGILNMNFVQVWKKSGLEKVRELHGWAGKLWKGLEK